MFICLKAYTVFILKHTAELKVIISYKSEYDQYSLQVQTQ